ncbi:MAG: hypothetical protein ACKVG7_04940 [Flavobacteriales bacterium]
MKFTSFLVAAMLVFSSCDKEDDTIVNDPVNNTPFFTWKIDVNSFSDNSPLVSINPSDVLTIDASSNSIDIRIVIYNFSNRTSGDVVTLSSLGDKAYITQNGTDYTDTQNGTFTFSEIGESKFSGTFNFKCRELVYFQSVTVTDGQFSNITY